MFNSVDFTALFYFYTQELV